MKMTLRARILLAFSIVVAIAVAQSLFGLYEMRRIKAAADEVDDNWLPSVVHSSAMNTLTSDFRVTQLRYLLAGDDAARTAIAAEGAKVLERLAHARNAYAPLVSSDQERELFATFEREWKPYADSSAELQALARAGQTAEAQALMARMAGHFDRSSEALDRIVELNQKGARAGGDETDVVYRTALIGAAVAMGLVVAVGATVAWTLSAGIRRRVAAAVVVAEGVASGDLSQRVVVDGHDEIAALQAAMGTMQARLAELVAQVRQGAESVATASAQIAQGNSDLSARTEEQASSLEQTAAAMEEINGTARSNADNASQANQLALRASEVARDGGQVVGEVVGTMRQIEGASRQIVDIISVIDGIAFQTNILALNAAVEAARAGEQGRGFAVVAGEVRTLAQRSAEAARQIKALIGTNVEAVEAGAALADKAGGTMAEIVGSIQRVADIVGEISSASQEQMRGVGQTSEAVTQMDQVTQQNAALVEESAAAAESLKGQAQALVALVAVFRVAGGHAAPARTAPAPAPTPMPAPQPAAAGWDGAERRSPNRATNVVRPSFAAPKAGSTPVAVGADEWETF